MVSVTIDAEIDGKTSISFRFHSHSHQKIYKGKEDIDLVTVIRKFPHPTKISDFSQHVKLTYMHKKTFWFPQGQGNIWK